MAWYPSRTGGFTLLEVIIIIAVMGFLAAMVAPFVGHLDKAHRIKATRERLESIRTAVAGPANTYDERGLRVIRGYAGDMDALPKLYQADWNSSGNRWDWSAGEVYNGGDLTDPDRPIIGQPRGLWEKETAGEDPGANWKGPYLGYPKAIFANQDKKDVNPLRKTEGVLADAWGRAVFFIKEQGDPGDPNSIYLLVVSAGPDGKVKLPGASSPAGPLDRTNPAKCYEKNATENLDNIVLEITPDEWYKPNLGVQEELTRRILDGIRTGLLGPPDAFDPSGRRIVGGYIGDMGKWPTLWEWDGTGGKWVTSSFTVGQPRGLWVWMGSGEGYSDHDPPATGPTGFCWRGPYLERPWGSGEEEILRDAWGEPLEFNLNTLATPETLTITSAGRNKTFDGIPPSGDDIQLIIKDSQWKAGGMKVEGKVTNNSTGELNNVKVSLYSQPLTEPISDDVISVGPGGTFSFELTGDVHAGKRTLKVFAGGTEMYSEEVFIGTGKTQSPVKEKLVFTVE